MLAKDKNRFLKEFLKNQVLQKMHVANYEMCVDQKPDLVTKGPQVCFMKFSDAVAKQWEKKENHYNDFYFQKIVAHAILFRNLDDHATNSDWYKSDREYKAQTVEYTISYFCYWLEKIISH